MSCERNLNKNSDIENADWNTSKHPNDNVRYGSASSQASQTSGDICRICHCENDANNPLLTPCYCSGSLKYVHQTCLQQWLTASETNACELCKFPFIMHTKIKPFCQWRGLDIPDTERRRLWCSILFHCAAALCVIWSLCVLIERAADDVKNGFIDWPFWTKLAVVAVGLTGGVIFMYIQCKAYLHLCHRWKARNRILLIQNVQEKVHAHAHTSPHSQECNSIISTQEKRHSNIIYTGSNENCDEDPCHNASTDHHHHHQPLSVLIEGDDNDATFINATLENCNHSSVSSPTKCCAAAAGMYSIPNSSQMSIDKSSDCGTSNCVHHYHHRGTSNELQQIYHTSNSQEIASVADVVVIDTVDATDTTADTTDTGSVMDYSQFMHCKPYCDIDDILQTDSDSSMMMIPFHSPSICNIPEYATNSNNMPLNDSSVDSKSSNLKKQDISNSRQCEQHQHFNKSKSYSYEDIETK